jgi:hypothetical protein
MLNSAQQNIKKKGSATSFYQSELSQLLFEWKSTSYLVRLWILFYGLSVCCLGIVVILTALDYL